MTTLLFSVLADQFEQLLYGLGLGDVLLNTFLGLVEGDLTSAGTDIAVVGIRHLTRAVHNTAHDTDLQAHEILRGSFDLGDGLLKVVASSTSFSDGN